MKKVLSLVLILGGIMLPVYGKTIESESTWYAAASKMDANQLVLLLILVTVVVLLLLLIALLLYLSSFISAVMKKENPADWTSRTTRSILHYQEVYDLVFFYGNDIINVI